MQQATDEHAAGHTMCRILSPASYSDFQARIHELFEAGEANGALALWASCVEMQHFPPCLTGSLSTQTCHQYESGRAPSYRVQGLRVVKEGTNFPLSGLVAEPQCWSHRVLIRRKLGLATMRIAHASPESRWQKPGRACIQSRCCQFTQIACCSSLVGKHIPAQPHPGRQVGLEALACQAV